MRQFTLTIDNEKLNKDIIKMVDERIDSEKHKIINNTIRELFEAPTFFNKQGGTMYQVLREQIETLALEQVARMDIERIRKDFERLFDKYLAEHLPVAVERAARKVAYQTADKIAKEKG